MASTTHPADTDKPANAKSGDNKSARAKVAETASQARDVAQATAENAVVSAQEKVADVQDSLARAGQAARESAERQPLMFAAGALAVGVVIGMAITARRN